ncbi:hypothetical protein TREMEDRAFT_69016 [Tremella mesenterica DSM 1558]|uniref:uncharacterized protein n=1 Tax=Tremella mesenterica (strain ATCC 24925 / CBS 8224 / DSM 1558 / NBRC 9311 / NRRL Y-6157 / RJB 2259-6 / UBC 559-6) TaxID=578456 RepID=UPI0003F499BF|nr:uncharacterized protein TREMEDRAFT_69016 [Tremella mesenterica DSM 1558]EIW69185.1 hypothetical protein TREMEDRAFT_69016 [Tremella mesenterica DSM 1558]
MSKRLSEGECGEIYGLHLAGKPLQEIASSYSVNNTTVTRTIQRKDDTGTHATCPRSGRPLKLTVEDEREILGRIDKDPNCPWQVFFSYGKELDDEGKQVSGSTVKRHMEEKEDLHKRVEGVKPWLPPHLGSWNQWAEDNEGQDWNWGIWTDECTVEEGSKKHGRDWTIHRPHKEFKPKHFKADFHSSRITIPVWSAITYNHKRPLFRIPIDKIRLPTNTIKTKYINLILRPLLHSYVIELQSEGHADVLVMSPLGLHRLPHPPYSPGLNPIESLWSDLKRELDKLARKSTSADQTFAEMERIWNAIPVSRVNRLIEGMESRRLALIAFGGLQTHF